MSLAELADSCPVGHLEDLIRSCPDIVPPQESELYRQHNEERMVVLSLHEHLPGFRDDRYLVCPEAWNSAKRAYEGNGHLFSVQHEALTISHVQEAPPERGSGNKAWPGDRFRNALQEEIDRKFPRRESQNAAYVAFAFPVGDEKINLIVVCSNLLKDTTNQYTAQWRSRWEMEFLEGQGNDAALTGFVEVESYYYENFQHSGFRKRLDREERVGQLYSATETAKQFVSGITEGYDKMSEELRNWFSVSNLQLNQVRRGSVLCGGERIGGGGFDWSGGRGKLKTDMKKHIYH